MKLPLSIVRRPWITSSTRFGLLFGGAVFSAGLAADSPAPAANTIVPTEDAAYVKAGQTSPGHVASDGQKKRIIQLWSDTPAYVTLLTGTQDPIDGAAGAAAGHRSSEWGRHRHGFLRGGRDRRR